MTSTALLNAYSSRNAGDGLLVESATRLLGEAGLIDRPDELVVVAADPDSFPSWNALPSTAATSIPLVRRGVQSAVVLLTMRAKPDERVCRAAVHVSVGGGYLRFGTIDAAAKATIVHLSQIATYAPSILLPQSIGPIRITRRRVLEVLRRVPMVCVRDDRSADELSVLPNVVRMPDLAVLDLAAGRPQAVGGGRRTVALVARPLKANGRYLRGLRTVVDLIGRDMVPALQSRAGRANNDIAVTERLFPSAPVSALKDLLSHPDTAVTVSTRLHGSLASLLAGVPTVHLSYERKGFGAFADLGLQRWVHNAYSFDPEEVIDQINELRTDPQKQFDRIEGRSPALMESREQLVSHLRAVDPRCG